MKLHEAFAKPTYRKRDAPRRQDYIVYDKKAEKYLGTSAFGITWKDAPEEAAFFETTESAHKALNTVIQDSVQEHPLAGHKHPWWDHYRELTPEEQATLDWHHVGKYIEIQEVVITTRVLRKIELGSD